MIVKLVAQFLKSAPIDLVEGVNCFEWSNIVSLQSIRTWFDKFDVEKLECPGQSPDFNSEYLGMQIASRHVQDEKISLV